jgi:hypothetical protein
LIVGDLALAFGKGPPRRLGCNFRYLSEGGDWPLRGIFNAIGNIVITPITIGYILQTTGSFNGALWFVAAHCLLAMFSYLVVVGKIRRVALRPKPAIIAAAAPAA